ncbi:VOC family protein [bacterium]|nr:VOC family protein [bacterium]
MDSYVEHANVSVTDLDKAVRFFTTAMPEFRVRHDSGPGPRRWVHLGTDSTYMSINQMEPPAEGTFDRHRPGYNHVGFGVADADALRARMLEAGYKEGFVPEPHPHRKRVYFIDDDGMEYEFIQYYSDIAAERNDYDL